MTDQGLPPCPLRPHRLCPGECQYILPAGACMRDPLPKKLANLTELFATWCAAADRAQRVTRYG